MIFSKTSHRFFENNFDILAISGIFSILLCPSCCLNYGFDMSYLCTFAVTVVYKMKFDNIFTEKILANLLATLMSLPFVIAMNQQISIFCLINSFVFTYLIVGIFVLLLLTF